MNRYLSSFILTTIVYSLIFVSFLYSFEVNKNVHSQPQQSFNNIKFTVIEKTIEAPKKVEKKENPKEKIVKKKPEPKKEQIVKKETPKKIEKKVIKKELAKKKPEPKKQIVKKKPEPKKEEIVKKETSKKIEKVVKKPEAKLDKKIAKQQIKQQHVPVKQNKPSIDQELINAKKNNYFKTIKESISKNKTYPNIAVRRGIQGDVKISFTISKEGELIAFKIIEGKKVFKKSIQSAIEKTFPIKPPKDIFLSNTDLFLTIAYRLN